LNSALTSVETKKLRPPKVDRFELKCMVLWSIIYILLGLANTVFDHYWVWHKAVAFILFLFTVAFGISLLVRKRPRGALSVFLALPILWAVDSAASAIGVDVKQRSFWLAKLYYSHQVGGGETTTFKWAENGWFLGGGWNYTLLHEPAAYSWNKFNSRSVDETHFIIGTSNKFKASKASDGSCQNENLRHLGGDWYLQTVEYGEGIWC
jgi:hypothetical protein